MTDRDWDRRYREGDLPWDTGVVDVHLAAWAAGLDPAAGPALELGCGTGTNAAWLAAHGWVVTAVDLAPTAVAAARGKMAASEQPVTLLVGDVRTVDLPGGPFALAFDRGVLHSMPDAAGRAAMAANVTRHLADDGLWLSLAGSADGPPRNEGPPRLSATELATAVEPCFELLELSAVRFRPDEDPSFEAWRCLLRKRRRWG